MKKALVLYDEKSNVELIRTVLSMAAKYSFQVESVSAGKWRQIGLEDISLLFNCMGERFVSGLERLLSEYVKSGGTLIHLGGNPFSVLEDGTKVAKGIRAFGIGDTFLEVPLAAKEYRLQGLGIYKTQNEQALPDLDKVYAGLYCLCHKDEEQQPVRHAELSTVAGLYEENGDMVAAPVVKVAYCRGGNLYLFTWTEKSGNILSGETAKDLLEKILGKCCVGEVRFCPEMTYARYYPGEIPEVVVKDICKMSKEPVNYEITVYKKGQQEAVETITVQGTSKKIRQTLPVEEEGQYEVLVRAYIGGVVVLEKKVGFYLFSEETMREEMKYFSGISIDPKVSTDFALRDGKPVAIHGTTYFVTDEYQKCFMHFNLAKCDEDLQLLQKDGFNMLRSGNWMLNVDFLGKDGSICEYARRALQAYFYCAMQHDFHIQFTLGNVALNDWDRSKCAIHNRQNNKKVHCLVENFARLFGEYKNVIMDVLNEPSYSRQGAWKPCRPSGDPYEKKAWVAWLKKKYANIEELRKAWGVNAARFPDFDTMDVPPDYYFEGTLYRTEQDREHAMVEDFWRFAQESYNEWLVKIRECVRKIAPNMPVIMGRDETLRVPEEQDCVVNGGLDMVCWHQWNYDAEIYTEYLLNRVKGHITCAQEVGIYRVEKMRGGKRLTDEAVAKKLERKLMFGFGNWVQWQSFHNPDKVELSENMLGIYRSDRSMTPAVIMMRKLILAEKEAMPYLQKRNEEAFPIVTLYSTSSHYSIYQEQAMETLRKHVYLLNRCLRMQSDVLLEHLFDEKYSSTIGQPALIMVPGIMRLSDSCFAQLMHAAKEGATVLISGNVEENEYFEEVSRIGEITAEAELTRVNVHNYEKLQIGPKQFLLDFRKGCKYGDAENFLNAAVNDELLCDGVYQVKQYRIGKGSFLYCPLPVELAEDREAALALYQYALEEAKVSPHMYSVTENKESFFIHAIAYEECTEYTVINEGAADSLVLTDLRGKRNVKFSLPSGRSCKVWIGTDGRILGKYAIDGVCVDVI